jgi:twitching motility protein PilT
VDVIQLVRQANLAGASDLHLLVNTPPMVRVRGALKPLPDTAPLTPEDLESGFNQVTSAKEKEEFRKNLELDLGFTVPDVARVRCNVALQQGTISMALRLIPTSVPDIEKLGIPEVCKELIMTPRGLIFVSGPAGSGKSTTLAAMLEYLNQHESRRLVTIEDPIEYIHANKKCVITQRELGTDTYSFAEALRHVLRQNPDVILVGEMRDVETASAALTIAETGHLVLTTGHAPSAYQACERMIDLFPPYERPLAQTRLASLLVAILCQALIPTTDGSGRVPAVEIMLANAAVKNLIREGKMHQLPNLIRTHTRAGMQLFDNSLTDLYRRGIISGESLFAYCNDRSEVDKMLNDSEKVFSSI